MTKKELVEKLSPFPDDFRVIVTYWQNSDDPESSGWEEEKDLYYVEGPTPQNYMKPNTIKLS